MITTAPGPVASGEHGGGPPPSTLPGLLLAHARARPAAVALRKKDLGRWREYSWEEYGTRSARTPAPARASAVPGPMAATRAPASALVSEPTSPRAAKKRRTALADVKTTQS